ncbi:polysaccharide biosynthesis/export family protein [Neorhodopirellula lusitana]|uniref:polysaccharide biosynthesis/export family protein n=1 Tax=Neorhodopirellula lusitana TaxID=445327 RepID=UPI00384B300A
MNTNLSPATWVFRVNRACRLGQGPQLAWGRILRGVVGSGLCLAVSTSLTGCSTLTQPINGIPAHRISPDFFPEAKNDLVPVDIALLSLEPPRDYQLGPDDILGVYIEGVLPFNPPNEPPQPPPVNFPQENSTLPPSIGYPIAVQDDGTLALPLIEPLKVEGFTLEQVRDKIREAYIENDILREEKARPIVTIIQERTYDVIVVREDAGGVTGSRNAGGETLRGSDRSASGGLVKLPAYKNDILHALVETGGLPGLNAKNEIRVLRASEADKRKRADFLRDYWAGQRAAMADPCYCGPDLPEDPSVLRIPLRIRPGVIPNISEDDITLQDGDIVYIENRDTEVFYTGGLLPGGEFQLPRDYDLDVIGAMALAGKGIGASQNNRNGNGLMSSVGQVPPGMLYILRKTPCNGQIAIEVDLAKATNDPRSRPLVQPGDILVLQYKCEEELLNFAQGTFFTYGIRELFNN